MSIAKYVGTAVAVACLHATYYVDILIKTLKTEQINSQIESAENSKAETLYYFGKKKIWEILIY